MTPDIKMTEQETTEADARIAKEMADYLDGAYADSSCAKSYLTSLYVEAFRKGKAAGIKEAKNG